MIQSHSSHTPVKVRVNEMTGPSEPISSSKSSSFVHSSSTSMRHRKLKSSIKKYHSESKNRKQEISESSRNTRDAQPKLTIKTPGGRRKSTFIISKRSSRNPSMKQSSSQQQIGTPVRKSSLLQVHQSQAANLMQKSNDLLSVGAASARPSTSSAEKGSSIQKSSASRFTRMSILMPDKQAANLLSRKAQLLAPSSASSVSKKSKSTAKISGSEKYHSVVKNYNVQKDLKPIKHRYLNILGTFEDKKHMSRMSDYLSQVGVKVQQDAQHNKELQMNKNVSRTSGIMQLKSIMEDTTQIQKEDVSKFKANPIRGASLDEIQEHGTPRMALRMAHEAQQIKDYNQKKRTAAALDNVVEQTFLGAMAKNLSSPLIQPHHSKTSLARQLDTPDSVASPDFTSPDSSPNQTPQKNYQSASVLKPQTQQQSLNIKLRPTFETNRPSTTVKSQSKFLDRMQATCEDKSRRAALQINKTSLNTIIQEQQLMKKPMISSYRDQDDLPTGRDEKSKVTLKTKILTDLEMLKRKIIADPGTRNDLNAAFVNAETGKHQELHTSSEEITTTSESETSSNDSRSEVSIHEGTNRKNKKKNMQKWLTSMQTHERMLLERDLAKSGGDLQGAKKKFEKEEVSRHLFEKYGQHLLTGELRTKIELIPMLGEHMRKTNETEFAKMKVVRAQRDQAQVRAEIHRFQKEMKDRNLPVPEIPQQVWDHAKLPDRFKRKITNEPPSPDRVDDEAHLRSSTLTKARPQRLNSVIRDENDQLMPLIHRQESMMFDDQLLSSQPASPGLRQSAVTIDAKERLGDAKIDIDPSVLEHLFKAKCKDIGRRIDDKLFIKFVENVTKRAVKRTLNVSCCQLGVESARVLMNTFLLQADKFAFYNLSENNFGNVGASLIASVLKQTSHIVALNLEMNKITSEGARGLAEGLRDNESLINLSLASSNRASNNRNRIMAQGVFYLAPVLKDNNFIQFLNLSGNSISDNGLELLLESLQTNEAIQYLNVGNNECTHQSCYHIKKFLKHNKSCTELILSKNDFGDKGIDIFADSFLHKRSQVIKLDISAIGLSRAGLVNLMKSLRHNHIMKSIRLDNNRMGSSQPYSLVGQVFHAGEGLGSILEEISCQNCELTDNFGTVFAEKLKDNKRIKKFNFSHNHLTCKTAAALATSLASKVCTLQEFNVSHNDIQDRGAKLLGQMIANNTTLKKIDLSHNNMMDEAGQWLNAGLQKNNKIVKLNLNSNLINLRFIDSINTKLKENRELQDKGAVPGLLREIKGKLGQVTEEQLLDQVHRLEANKKRQEAILKEYDSLKSKRDTADFQERAQSMVNKMILKKHEEILDVRGNELQVQLQQIKAEHKKMSRKVQAREVELFKVRKSCKDVEQQIHMAQIELSMKESNHATDRRKNKLELNEEEKALRLATFKYERMQRDVERMIKQIETTAEIIKRKELEDFAAALDEVNRQKKQASRGTVTSRKTRSTLKRKTVKSPDAFSPQGKRGRLMSQPSGVGSMYSDNAGHLGSIKEFGNSDIQELVKGGSTAAIGVSEFSTQSRQNTLDSIRNNLQEKLSNQMVSLASRESRTSLVGRRESSNGLQKFSGSFEPVDLKYIQKSERKERMAKVVTNLDMKEQMLSDRDLWTALQYEQLQNARRQMSKEAFTSSEGFGHLDVRDDD